jgi:hypothetical protein
MSWLHSYSRDIMRLEAVQVPSLPEMQTESKLDTMIAEFKKIMEPLKDGSLDPGDVDEIIDNHWESFGQAEIEAARKLCQIQRRLAPMYEKLADASDEEWQEYVKIKVKARYTFGMPLWLAVRVFKES